MTTGDEIVSPGIMTVISEDFVRYLLDNLNEIRSEIVALLVMSSEFVDNIFIKYIKGNEFMVTGTDFSQDFTKK
jgi:hypothetical protein